jgi:hypothetical protein
VSVCVRERVCVWVGERERVCVWGECVCLCGWVGVRVRARV